MRKRSEKRPEGIEFRSDRELLAAGGTPQRKQVKRERPIEGSRTTRVDAHLLPVEENAIPKCALFDVASDLPDMCRQRLARSLRIEHKPVRDEVCGSEVGLQATLATLGKVVTLPEAHDVLEERCEQRLGERFLVRDLPF